MGKFEKRVQNSFKGDIEDFNVWFAKNREEFPGFTGEPAKETEIYDSVKVKKKKSWLLLLAFFLAAVCVVLCFLPLMLQDKEPTRFGDAAVYEHVLDGNEMTSIIQDNPLLSEITFSNGKQLLKSDDDSLVFAILSGEWATDLDYYFLTVRIEYNPYYDFISKPSYEELKNQVQINGYLIQYGFIRMDTDGLFWYNVLSEKNGRKIYWEIHCFEESIEQFIQTIFSE